VATEGEVEFHDTVEVASCVVPSERVAIAANFWGTPRGTAALPGVSVMEVTVAGPTVSVLEPQSEPAQARMVTGPLATAYACPRLLASPVTVVMVLSDELQVIDWRVCGPPGENVPVAVNCRITPGKKLRLVGVIAMDTSEDGVKLVG
jgi:hypothetical protein